MLFFIFSLSTLPLCVFYFINLPPFTSTSGFICYFLSLSFSQKAPYLLLVFIFITLIIFFYRTTPFNITPYFNTEFSKCILFFKKFFSYENFKKMVFFLYILPTSALKWKPLFKKTSYFGVYKANRNKWLNK